jgi:hypothetical protein
LWWLFFACSPDPQEDDDEIPLEDKRRKPELRFLNVE